MLVDIEESVFMGGREFKMRGIQKMSKGCMFELQVVGRSGIVV